MSSAGDSLSGHVDLDRPLALHPLVYLEEKGEVTVGRVDADSYAVFPPEGAELVRGLANGLSPRDVARAYQEAHGEGVDIADLLAALQELGFVRSPQESAASPDPVRWQRLGRALFSRPALAGCLMLLLVWIAEMVRVPQLAPRPANLFFTSYFSIIELTLYLGQFPFLVIHEAFHALAGRRLGLPSRLSVGHRLIFVVLETSLDGLVAVPRPRRYLPILAGMLADGLIAAVLTLTADLTRLPGGGLPFGGRLCLALAYATMLRLAWQAFLYLRTDLYVLLSTVLGCHDLHATAKGLLGNAVRRMAGRPPIDESAWHPTDRRVARWYAWLMVAGYAFTLVVFADAVVPVGYRFVVGVFDRFTGRPQLGSLIDSTVLLGLIAGQLLAVVVLIARDRRRGQHQPSTPALG